MTTALQSQMPHHAGPGSVGSSGNNNNAPTWSAGSAAAPLTGLNDYAPASPPGGTQALLAEYFRYIYRFIPVFLAPAHVGSVASAMSPSSPFLLAIQAVIPFLREEPLQDGMHPSQVNFGSAKHERVRETTTRFERMASEAIDEALERIESSSEDAGTSEAITLEVIQALSVLVIYEVSPGAHEWQLGCRLMLLCCAVWKRTSVEGAPQGGPGAWPGDVQGLPPGHAAEQRGDADALELHNAARVGRHGHAAPVQPCRCGARAGDEEARVVDGVEPRHVVRVSTARGPGFATGTG